MVNYDDLMIEFGAELCIHPSIEPDVRPDSVALLDFRPPFAECRSADCHPAANDGDEPSARPQSKQGLLDMPRAEPRVVAVDAATRRREWRVHHDCVIELAIWQEVIEPLGVKRRHAEILQCKQSLTTLGDFVDVDFGASHAG